MDRYTVEGFLQEIRPYVNPEANIPTDLLVSGLSKMSPAEFASFQDMVRERAHGGSTTGMPPMGNHSDMMPMPRHNSRRAGMGGSRRAEMMANAPRRTSSSMYRSAAELLDDVEMRFGPRNRPMPAHVKRELGMALDRLNPNQLEVLFDVLADVARTGLWRDGREATEQILAMAGGARDRMQDSVMQLIDYVTSGFRG